MRFGEYVRDHGFTAKELAAKAGVSVRSVENYTTGRRAIKNMTLDLASKLAMALDLHAEDLLGLDD